LNCVEALAACFYICGHPEWAEDVLESFSYGEAFLDINASLLKRYAACKDEVEVKKAEEVWLEKIEKEYTKHREDKEGGGEEDVWAGGNMNRRMLDDDDDDEKEDGEESEEERVPQNSYDMPESDDDEEEMAELRRRVLASKPFANPTAKDEDEKQEAERIPMTEPIPRTEPAQAEEAEDDKLGSGPEDNGDDDDEFDSFMNAQPTTDRTGIAGKQRQKAMNKKGTTVSFTSASLKAHSNGR
jgi:pre-rRNA-processing protein TSR3